MRVVFKTKESGACCDRNRCTCVLLQREGDWIARQSLVVREPGRIGPNVWRPLISRYLQQLGQERHYWGAGSGCWPIPCGVPVPNRKMLRKTSAWK